jgi:1-phosphofructokinase
MIVTLTPNTAIDLIVTVPKLTPNRTIRSTDTQYSMGGKPTDASWILGRMGVSSRALGLSAGAIGVKVNSMLSEFGVRCDFVEADGETRINTVILDEASGEQTTITTASMTVTEAQLDQLRAKTYDAIQNATVLVTGGSLPAGVPSSFYEDVIRLAREYNVPVIFDASEPHLKVGLEAKPSFIKPNQHELSVLVGRDITTIEEAYKVGKDILQEYGTQSVITFGKEGALAILKDCSYRIPPIEIEVKSAAGAGDSVLAGLAHAIYHGNPIEEGLKLGIATATAVCLQVGTAAYDVRGMKRLLPQVELIAYP